MEISILDLPVSTVTGEITVPAKLAQKFGIKKGMRLAWEESNDPQMITAHILPDPMAGVQQ